MFPQLRQARNDPKSDPTPPEQGYLRTTNFVVKSKQMVSSTSVKIQDRVLWAAAPSSRGLSPS
jgi:hypothetical protein